MSGRDGSSDGLALPGAEIEDICQFLAWNGLRVSLDLEFPHASCELLAVSQ